MRKIIASVGGVVLAGTALTLALPGASPVGAATAGSGNSFFTVAYANGNCDPAQAFPVGPFQTNSRGVGYLNMTVSDPTGAIVAGTRSVSVRIGDDQTDKDGDGKLGPTDVVAVPGKPSIGLVECDGAPLLGANTAVGKFSKQLLGVSVFTESGTAILVRGIYTRLRQP